MRFPDPEAWVGESLPEAPIVEAILAQGGEGTAQTRGIDGVLRLYAFTPVPGTRGGEEVYVSIGVPAEKPTTEKRSLRDVLRWERY